MLVDSSLLLIFTVDGKDELIFEDKFSLLLRALFNLSFNSVNFDNLTFSNSSISTISCVSSCWCNCFNVLFLLIDPTKEADLLS